MNIKTMHVNFFFMGRNRRFFENLPTIDIGVYYNIGIIHLQNNALYGHNVCQVTLGSVL